MHPEILYLHDAEGALAAVQIPAVLWAKIEPLLAEEVSGKNAAPRAKRGHDLAAFAGFTNAWTFPYAYDPAVACPHCGASTPDWRQGGPFTLANANIGGLLVFHCANCGATVRQKFFKDHMDCEFTPPAR